MVDLVDPGRGGGRSVVDPADVLHVTESIRAALMLLMGILVVTDAPLGTILVAAVVAAGAGTFATPAFGRLVPEVAADAEQLGRANVVGSGLDSLACVIGPGIAALLIVSGGLELAFVLNGLSFLGVVVVLCRIPVPSRRSSSDHTRRRWTRTWSRRQDGRRSSVPSCGRWPSTPP